MGTVSIIFKLGNLLSRIRSRAAAMAPTFKFINRASKDVPFEVPEGYHRVAFKERGVDKDFCGWEAFCFGLAMQDPSIMVGMGAGLMAPVALGQGEEWRILEGEDPPAGWKIMPVTRETFDSYMPRLGYLPQDQNMDEAKLGDGRQKFILKESTEGTSQCQVPRTKYSAFAYQIYMLNEWIGASDHEKVEMTGQMWEDMEIDPTLLQELKDGKKRLVGKI